MTALAGLLGPGSLAKNIIHFDSKASSEDSRFKRFRGCVDLGLAA